MSFKILNYQRRNRDCVCDDNDLNPWHFYAVLQSIRDNIRKYRESLLGSMGNCLLRESICRQSFNNAKRTNIDSVVIKDQSKIKAGNVSILRFNYYFKLSST